MPSKTKYSSQLIRQIALWVRTHRFDVIGITLLSTISSPKREFNYQVSIFSNKKQDVFCNDLILQKLICISSANECFLMYRTLTFLLYLLLATNGSTDPISPLENPLSAYTHLKLLKPRICGDNLKEFWVRSSPTHLGLFSVCFRCFTWESILPSESKKGSLFYGG